MEIVARTDLKLPSYLPLSDVDGFSDCFALIPTKMSHPAKGGTRGVPTRQSFLIKDGRLIQINSKQSQIIKSREIHHTHNTE
jgi:hypothetical protein